MKTLPAHPNIDHLRRQAKEHLRELRRSRPDASLGEAQSSLAEQYGFRTWGDLKAEVDRRSGSAVEILDPRMAAGLADLFGLGHVGHVTLVERGPMATVFRVETNLGRWLLKQLPDWAQGDGAEEDVRLTEAAIDAGVRTPTPMRSAAGRIVEEVVGRRWRAFEWLDLGPAPTHPVAPDVAAAMGSLLAQLHRLSLPATGPLDPWLTDRPSEGEWGELRAVANSAGGDWAPLLEAAIPTLIDVGTIAADHTPDGEPILCHSNLVPGNLRLLGDAGLAPLNWEQAGPLPPRWEFGYVLLLWATGPGDHVDADVARALSDAYLAAAQPVGALDLDIFTTAITAVLNWTSSRVAIAIEDDQPDAQAAAADEIPGLLRNPLSRHRLTRLLDCVA